MRLLLGCDLYTGECSTIQMVSKLKRLSTSSCLKLLQNFYVDRSVELTWGAAEQETCAPFENLRIVSWLVLLTAKQSMLEIASTHAIQFLSADACL